MLNPIRSAVASNKLAYDDPPSVASYEADRFGHMLGRARDRRERKASHSAIQQFMPGSTVLDCPTGNGRWYPRLAIRANHIIGIDVAPAMAAAAAAREVPGTSIEVKVGDAEKIDLPDDAVEHVFCFALMKHLPRAQMLNVLREFRRVSSGRIVVSFCLSTPLSYAFWRARRGSGYLLSRTQLDGLATEASYRVGAIYNVGVPILGLESIVVLEPEPTSGNEPQL